MTGIVVRRLPKGVYADRVLLELVGLARERFLLELSRGERIGIEAAIADFRSSAHVERLELQDLLAVKECTDSRFLPARFRDLTLAEVNLRVLDLRRTLGE